MQPAALRIALGLFVLVWIFGPYGLRAAVPVWLVFLIALGLEIHFFLGAVRQGEPRETDRGPQPVDLERFGYPDEDEEEPRVPPPDRPRHPLQRALAGLAVVGAVGVALWVVEARTGWDALPQETKSRAEARFSAEASAIAGKPVTVRCDESGRRVGVIQHADGAAVVGGELAFLTPERCLDLYRLAFKGEIRGSRTGRAIVVLAHEAWHLRGVRDEGRTECNALRSGVELGRRLGLSSATARELMRQQRAENPLYAAESPEYLLPPDC